MSEAPKPFRLEPVPAPPAGTPLLADDAPNHFWLLSNGRGWSLALGQNMGGAPPEVHAAPSGILFVGLYHGRAASVRADDGRIVDQVALSPGNMVFWAEHGGLIVAEGELEVGVFEPGGRFLWRAGLGDVIESVECAGGVLTLTDAAGRSASFDARTGKSA